MYKRNFNIENDKQNYEKTCKVSKNEDDSKTVCENLERMYDIENERSLTRERMHNRNTKIDATAQGKGKTTEMVGRVYVF